MLKHFFSFALHSSELLFLVILISFVVKIYLIKLLIPSGFKKFTIKHSWLFLLGTLIGTFFGDLAWIVKLMREMRFLTISYPSLVFLIRISWGFLILQYQSLSLFLESLIIKKFVLLTRHKLCLLLSTLISGYFFYIALFESGLTSKITRSAALHQSLWSFEMPLEIKMMNIIIYFSLFCLMIPSIIITLRKSNKTDLPIIVRHQLSTLLKYLIGSYLLVEILQVINFIFTSQAAYVYPIVSVSTLILSYAIYYSITSVLGIRFLNAHTHVQSNLNLNVIHNFKNVLEQLSHVTSIQEVCQISQLFFKDAFGIPFRKAQLYLRTNNLDEAPFAPSEQKIQIIVENFISNHCPRICEYILQEKILIYDELDFSNFYQPHNDRTILLNFLKDIDADIFLPIYEKKSMIAYILVDRYPEKRKLYGNVERDEMIIFAGYLSNIINLLQKRNLPSLIHHEKLLQEDLYHCQQEIKQYRESIRSFISNNPKHIGIIFFKNRRFTFGNQAARELISINLNTQNGHYLTKICRQIVQEVVEYKSAQTTLTSDERGNKLVLSAVPNLEQNNIILIVHPPEMSDILAKQVNILQDPTKWDYLLYLETTKAGQLINQLIPGNGELLLNFKINLLQTILSRKTTLLKMADDDLLPTIELLHHLSNGETLHVMSLEHPYSIHEIAMKLFGINPQLGIEHVETPLFKQLDKNSTLVIKDVHLLPLEIQECLAEYIKYGYYSVFNSEKRMKSNVRLIFSTNENLVSLMQDGTFSKPLYKEINNSLLHMPLLKTLPEKEFYDLIDGLTEQAIRTADFKKMLALTENEKMKIIHSHPSSLQDLRIKIEQILVKKSKKNNIFQETYFDPAYHITDPELTEAARLGKHALRDVQIMGLLWNKFKSQNKIADFLGVNRSSVNRRCKQYNLH